LATAVETHAASLRSSIKAIHAPDSRDGGAAVLMGAVPAATVLATQPESTKHIEGGTPKTELAANLNSAAQLGGAGLDLNQTNRAVEAIAKTSAASEPLLAASTPEQQLGPTTHAAQQQSVQQSASAGLSKSVPPARSLSDSTVAVNARAAGRVSSTNDELDSENEQREPQRPQVKVKRPVGRPRGSTNKKPKLMDRKRGGAAGSTPRAAKEVAPRFSRGPVMPLLDAAAAPFHQAARAGFGTDQPQQRAQSDGVIDVRFPAMPEPTAIWSPHPALVNTYGKGVVPPATAVSQPAAHVSAAWPYEYRTQLVDSTGQAVAAPGTGVAAAGGPHWAFNHQSGLTASPFGGNYMQYGYMNPPQYGAPAGFPPTAIGLPMSMYGGVAPMHMSYGNWPLMAMPHQVSMHPPGGMLLGGGYDPNSNMVAMANPGASTSSRSTVSSSLSDSVSPSRAQGMSAMLGVQSAQPLPTDSRSAPQTSMAAATMSSDYKRHA